MHEADLAGAPHRRPIGFRCRPPAQSTPAQRASCNTSPTWPIVSLVKRTVLQTRLEKKAIQDRLNNKLKSRKVPLGIRELAETDKDHLFSLFVQHGEDLKQVMVYQIPSTKVSNDACVEQSPQWPVHDPSIGRYLRAD